MHDNWTALFLSAELRCHVHVSSDETASVTDNRDFSTATLDDLKLKVVKLIPCKSYCTNPFENPKWLNSYSKN